MNKVYFTRAKQFLESQVKGPNAFQDGALMNRIKKLPKPKPKDLKAREKYKIPTTSIAVNHIKVKTVRFSERKTDVDSAFRKDHTCLLVLADHLVMNVPDNLKCLLFYHQKGVSHTCWITTASGYLRMLIFGYGVEPHDIPKLQRMASFIVCVYLPAFFAKPVFNAVQEHFVHHSSQWLNPKTIALNVYAEIPPFTFEAVKKKTFSKQINIEQIIWKRGTLRDLFTEDSKWLHALLQFLFYQRFG